MKRILAIGATGLGLGAGLVLLTPASPASAHPLGRFSVNQLQSLSLHPDRIDLRATVDLAELPTVQDRSTVDTSGDGTADEAELQAYAEKACNDLAGKLDVAIDADRLRWSLKRPTFIYQAGAAGLQTSRLDCELTVAADLGRPREVRLDNHYLVDRVGWREITAVGDGVRLIDPPVPAVSRSGSDLRSYPEELLASPPDVRSVVLRVEPGSGAPVAASSTVDRSDGGSWTTRLVSAGEEQLNAFVGARGQGPLVGLLAVVLALTLGAAHAALPGHGKTIMAAYLAGKRGRARDAVAVGGVVTATHTGGVLVVGLLLTTFAGLVGEAVLAWLGVASGILVVAVGLVMLIGLRRKDHGHGWLGHGHSHAHGSRHSHAHASDHSHDYTDDGRLRRGSTHDNHVHRDDVDGQAHASDGHAHADGEHAPSPGGDEHAAQVVHEQVGHVRVVHVQVGHVQVGHEHGDHEHGDHEHGHRHEEPRPSRLGIAGIGIAGGLVPSPSALIVLLGAIALGRTWFGVLLVVAYGLGMAATLTAAGLALVGLQRRWAARTHQRGGDRWKALAAKLSRVMPSATGSLVLIVGIGLVGRAAATLI
jgi:ABC-type nickel/cobalt efflux system permease component RcnA